MYYKGFKSGRIKVEPKALPFPQRGYPLLANYRDEFIVCIGSSRQYCNSTFKNYTYIYSIELDIWVQGPKMAQNHYHANHSCCALGDSIYALRGEAHSNTGIMEGYVQRLDMKKWLEHERREENYWHKIMFIGTLYPRMHYLVSPMSDTQLAILGVHNSFKETSKTYTIYSNSEVVGDEREGG